MKKILNNFSLILVSIIILSVVVYLIKIVINWRQIHNAIQVEHGKGNPAFDLVDKMWAQLDKLWICFAALFVCKIIIGVRLALK